MHNIHGHVCNVINDVCGSRLTEEKVHSYVSNRRVCNSNDNVIRSIKGSNINKRITKILNNIDQVIANSNYTKNLAIEVGINPNKIIVINPGIDTTKNLDQKYLKIF